MVYKITYTLGLTLAFHSVPMELNLDFEFSPSIIVSNRRVLCIMEIKYLNVNIRRNVFDFLLTLRCPDQGSKGGQEATISAKERTAKLTPRLFLGSYNRL